MKRFLSLILMLSIVLSVTLLGCTPVSNTSESNSEEESISQPASNSEVESITSESQSQESTSTAIIGDEDYSDVMEFDKCFLLKNFIIGSKDMIGNDIVYLDIDGIVDPDYEGAPWEYYQSRCFSYDGIRDGKFINPTVLIECEIYDEELGVVLPEEVMEGVRYYSYSLIVRSKPFDYSGGEFTFERSKAVDQWGKNCMLVRVLDGNTVACEMFYDTDLEDIPLSYFEDLFNANKCLIEGEEKIKYGNLDATFTNNCSGIIRTEGELSTFISDNGIVFGEGVDLSAYTEEFFEQKALIFLCQLAYYRSWSFYDLFIEDGKVFLYGAAEEIIYYNSAGEKQEGVKKAYCFCVEVEKSLVQSATEVEYCIEVYDWVEMV